MMRKKFGCQSVGFWWGSPGRRPWPPLWLVGACCFLALPAARAQQVLVQANVADDTVKTTFGPNRRLFGHGYLGFGLLAGPAGPGAGLRYGLGSRWCFWRHGAGFGVAGQNSFAGLAGLYSTRV